jgi:hypothetical protein
MVMLSKAEVLIFYKLGKFYVENDTLVPILKEDAGKVVDEDVNNKMFIVVRNLKTTSNKIVRKIQSPFIN